jgi:hypothetical protein
MARRFPYVVNRADIGMIERRSGPRFALKTFPRSTCGKSIRRKGLRQNFDGDVAVEPRIARFIYFAHATRANGRKDLVWAEEFTRG